MFHKLSSTTLSIYHATGITLFGIAFHSSIINYCNSTKLLGIRNSAFLLMIAHKFSMGFKSGLLDGQSITSGTFSFKNSLARRLVCLGSVVILLGPPSMLLIS